MILMCLNKLNLLEYFNFNFNVTLKCFNFGNKFFFKC